MSIYPGYFDKQGQPITPDQMSELRYDLDADGKVSDYARIGFDEVDGAEVSTVWLGINHNFTGAGPPIIFETMLFGYREDDNPCTRYCTESEAAAGHARVVEDLRAGRVPWFEQDSGPEFGIGEQ